MECENWQQQIIQHVILKENEDNWELKEKSLLKLNSLITTQLPSTQLIGLFKNFHFIEGYAKMINSLRTQLAVSACQTLVTIVQHVRADFEPFGEYFMNVLIKACGQTKKIVANSAAQTVKALIFDVPSVKYLQLFNNILSDKNPVLRAKGAEFFRDLVPKVNFRALSKGPAIELFEDCLRKTLGDGNAIVRTIGYEVLDMYQLIWPDRIIPFIDSLDYLTRKQLMKRDEKSANSPRKPHGEGKNTLLQEEPSSIFSPSKLIHSPRKSLYEDFLENENKRTESRSILEKSVEFLKQNQVELKVFHILGLKELEEIALQESPRYLPIQAMYDEKMEPLNLLKNIIVRSKDDSLWSEEQFRDSLEAIFNYARQFNKQNALYAFFVLLSNQGNRYMRSIDHSTWKQLMNLLAERNPHDMEEFKSIEDEIIFLIATHLPFEQICLMFIDCCENNVVPSFKTTEASSHLSSSCLGFSSSKFVENHFDLLHHALMSCTSKETIVEYLELLREALYLGFLCTKTKLLANKIFIELYRRTGGERLFDVFCKFDRPTRQFLKISSEFGR